MSNNLSSINITFRLNNGLSIKDPNKQATIYIRVRKGREIDFKSSLGIKVLSKDWEQTKQRIKNRVHLTNRDENNGLLASLSNHITDEYTNLKRKGTFISKSTIANIYKSFFEDATQQDKSLFSFLKGYIENAKSRPNPITGKVVSKSTLKDYTAVKNMLKRFNDEQYKIDFDSITLDFYYDFIDWCYSQGYSTNYIGKHIKGLKSFMNEAVEQGLTNNLEFKKRRFQTLKEDVLEIYLTIDELNKMWKLDLTKEPYKQRIRDLFLIGCYTGLRVSDFNHINKSNIIVFEGVEMLKIETEKTSKNVSIPLHDIVKMIFERYNGPPKKVPSQHINKQIKIIGASAKIEHLETKTITKGGKKLHINKPKCELIMSHTARRSFCTNAYLSGMSQIDIMAISGHGTEKNFLKYIKVSPEQRAVKMANHPFFQSTSLKVV